jgi:hypothetical protein
VAPTAPPTPTTAPGQATGAKTVFVTVDATTTLKLYALRNGGGTRVESDGNGWTLLSYVKLAD